ncbi:MAG: reprolysin-like metallopeptidase, partial [Chthoniobacterales bacterium]
MLRSTFVVILLALTAFVARAQSPLWTDIDEKPMLAAAARTGNVDVRRNIIPQKYRTLGLNRAALETALSAAPPETTGPLDAASVEVTIPLPDGGFGRFNIQESPVMDPKLAAKYPEIKTYVGQGIDDPTASMRMDLTPRGFHAMILSPKGQTYIDPYWRDSDATYVAYYKKDFVADKPFSCLVDSGAAAQKNALEQNAIAPERPTGATLRKYRLALACTAEYAAAVCSPDAANVPETLAAMVTSVNRVSAVYERDFAIRFVLIGNTDLLIYLNAATDPYSNGNGSTMLGQNQTNIDNVIGSANYDFGHVFSTGGGGIADLGVICLNGSKAMGVTGTSDPRGDPYDIDYVAHEMGHQFGGDHTFNSTVGSCGGGNRNGSTAYEVGSGITIMAYAGICGNTDLAPHSDDYFHTGNYTEIDNYTSSGTGSSCPVTSATGNNPPVIGALSASTIPANTPFALTGSATDADGDTITYDWEEFDLGTSQSTQNPSPSGTNPIFRSYAPTLSPTRYFPSLTYILDDANVPPATNADGYATGEVLPSVARTMTFRLTARDNRAGGGGSNWASTTVTTVATGSAFAVTAPNTSVTFAGGSQQTVTWNVAGTDVNGINCANVKISLSTDGGNTFPTILASSIPNNGSAIVTIPQIATVQGRIKVEAVGNIFFDISDADFTSTSNNNAPTLNITGGITVARGTPTATVAIVGTVNDTDGDALTVSVSDLPYRASVTPTLVGNNISL